MPDALGELATTISGLNTNKLSDSLTSPGADVLRHPAATEVAVEGVARFSQTLNERDAQLRELLANANKSTAVLAQRSDQVVSLIVNTNALLAQLQTQSSALDEISGNISALSQQLSGFVADNRATMRPALDKLNGVLAIIDNRKERVQKSTEAAQRYAMSLGESVSSGPFFKAYIANLLPGQFIQPFVDAAFSDLGLDPNVLLPSERTDPQTGQPGMPALPVPYPRTGQGGEPHLTLPDAITGKPGDPGAAHRDTAARPDWLLSVPRTTARTTARRPAAGTAGAAPPGLASLPDPHRRRCTCRRRVRRADDRGAPPVKRNARIGLAVGARRCVVAGVVVLLRFDEHLNRTNVVAYFDNSNGIFAGDDVRILGVKVGKIDKIEPQPERPRSPSGSTTSTRCPPTRRR